MLCAINILYIYVRIYIYILYSIFICPHLVQCWGALLHHVTSYLLDFPWCVIVSDKVTTSSCRPANVTLALGDLAKSQDT